MQTRFRFSDHRPRLPAGITVHAINMTEYLGTPRELEGQLIVEMPDSSLHKLTGAEMTEWNEALVDFVANWRLP